jgi:hypothetical protein
MRLKQTFGFSSCVISPEAKVIVMTISSPGHSKFGGAAKRTDGRQFRALQHN